LESKVVNPLVAKRKFVEALTRYTKYIDNDDFLTPKPNTISKHILGIEEPNATEEMELLPGIGPILARILSQRGIRSPAEADEFLHHRYSGHRDPFLLSDMDRAVHRIQRAVENEELIVVYGDFDADGV
jgi:hypothetical protein